MPCPTHSAAGADSDLAYCTVSVNPLISINMIKSFASKATEDIYHGVSSKSAKSLPESIWGVAQRKLDMINAAHLLSDLRIPPGNRLERLKGNMSSYHALRINDQFRIVFRWVDGHAFEVTIVDYH